MLAKLFKYLLGVVSWIYILHDYSNSEATDIFLFGGISFEQVIAEHLSVEEVAGIKEGFQLMDTGNKGKINIDELRVGLIKLGHQIADADVQILMEAVSIIGMLSLQSSS